MGATRRVRFRELCAGVCESTPEDPPPPAESHKEGDAAAAVRRLEMEEGRNRQARIESLAIASATGRSISIWVASTNPDLPDSVRGKRVVWRTEVNDTTTVEHLLEEWYSVRGAAAINLDGLSDLGGLECIIPQWCLIEDDSPAHRYRGDSSFEYIFRNNPTPAEGLIRFVGEGESCEP